MKISKFVLCFSFWGVSTIALAENVPILDGVIIGKTELVPYIQNLKNNCPKAVIEQNAIGSVPANCYNLPGNYVLLLSDPKDPTHRILSATIVYPKDFDSKTFNLFYDSLKRKYGEPVSKQIPFVGSKEVEWTMGSMYIILQEEHLEQVGSLNYLDKALWEITRQRMQQTEQKQKKSLDDML